jgi:hypothetical protein
MLTGLPQPAHMRLNRLAQPRKAEVPLASQAVAPTAGLYCGIKLLGEYAKDVGAASGTDQIQIVAQVGPMVQRLHDCYRTIRIFQGLADRVEMAQGASNAGPLNREPPDCPSLEVQVATISCDPVNDRKDPDHYVVGLSQIAEILPLLRAQGIQEWH